MKSAGAVFSALEKMSCETGLGSHKMACSPKLPLNRNDGRRNVRTTIDDMDIAENNSVSSSRRMSI